jgi:hypothetical protein
MLLKETFSSVLINIKRNNSFTEVSLTVFVSFDWSFDDV